MAHPFLTVNKAQFSSFAPKNYFHKQPSVAYSGSVSFDVLVNQPQNTQVNYDTEFNVFRAILNFYDKSYRFLYRHVFQVRVQMRPEVNLELDSPRVSGQIEFTLELRSDKNTASQFVLFGIGEAASCFDSSSVGVNLSNKSVSQQLQSLNYTQILSKLTLFYKVENASL